MKAVQKAVDERLKYTGDKNKQPKPSIARQANRATFVSIFAR
jgi:hypothetical protein